MYILVGYLCVIYLIVNVNILGLFCSWVFYDYCFFNFVKMVKMVF